MNEHLAEALKVLNEQGAMSLASKIETPADALAAAKGAAALRSELAITGTSQALLRLCKNLVNQPQRTAEEIAQLMEAATILASVEGPEPFAIALQL